MRRYSSVFSAVMLLLLGTMSFAGPQAKAPARPPSPKGVPTWMAIRADVENQWKTSNPNEQVLNIEKEGELQFSEEPGKTETIWDWGSATTIKGREGSYLRQTVLVTIERANKTRARFSVGALYKFAGNKWHFAELPVGKVEELPGAGAPAQPTNEEAAKIFAEAWKKVRPEFDVNSVEVLAKPTFGQAKGRYWFSYKLALVVTGTKKGYRERFGKKYKCSPEAYSSVLKWDAENKVWAADERMIQIVNESRDCEDAE